MVKPPNKVKTNNEATDKALGGIYEFCSLLGKKSLLDYNIIEGVTITSGASTSVRHKLGRKLIGWVAIRDTCTGKISEATTQGDLAVEIRLTASANGTANILVF